MPTTTKPAPSKLPRTRTFKPVSVRDVTPFSQSDALDSMTGPAVTFYVTDKQGPRFEKPRLQLPMVAEPIQWLWPGKIPLGRVTLIEGPAGAGKSTLALDLAARVSSGKAWPDGSPQRVWPFPSSLLCALGVLCVSSHWTVRFSKRRELGAAFGRNQRCSPPTPRRWEQ